MRPKSFHSVLLFVLCLAFFGGSAMAQSIIVNDQMKSKKNAVYRSNIDQTKYDKRTLSNGKGIRGSRHGHCYLQNRRR